MSRGVTCWGAMLTAIVAITLPVVSEAAPLFYSGKEIRATVIDADTSQAIEGAVVVVVWQLRPISGEGPRLHVAETVTDAGGAFLTPAWGPKARLPLTEAQSDFPYLVVFKHGYVPVRLHNAPKGDFARIRARTNMPAERAIDATTYEGTPSESVQESVWNGTVIRIEPFRGNPEEWFSRLQSIQIDAGWRDVARTRRFHEALLAERDYFRSHPLDPKKVANS